MDWDFKHTHFFRAKIWLDTKNRKILLAESYGRNENTFDYKDIKNIIKGSARSSSNKALYFTVKDMRKPEYMVEFSTQSGVDEWFARLNIALDLSLI